MHHHPSFVLACARTPYTSIMHGLLHYYWRWILGLKLWLNWKRGLRVVEEQYTPTQDRPWLLAAKKAEMVTFKHYHILLCIKWPFSRNSLLHSFERGSFLVLPAPGPPGRRRGQYSASACYGRATWPMLNMVEVTWHSKQLREWGPTSGKPSRVLKPTRIFVSTFF